MYTLKEYRDRFYRVDEINNDKAFLDTIEAVVRPDMRVLDAGAGAGDLFRYDLKDRVREMVGVDLDPRVTSNPRLHRGIQSDLTDIPCEKETFDMVFCRYVLEHVTAPQAFLAEMHRILRPGGRFLFLTPNKWHYVSIAARLTPHSFHGWYNRRRGRADQDTFPTVYRLNSRSDIKREFGKAGFIKKRLELRECCPNYLAFSRPTFLLGVAYERTVNASEQLDGLRVNFLGDFERIST